MTEIHNMEFGGERPLFASHDLVLDHVSILPGESALKRCRNIVARDCTFDGKYPFWHCSDFSVADCLFKEGARAALWYSKGCTMRRCRVDAPKMFRMMMDIDVEDTVFADAEETLWDCAGVRLRRVEMHRCDYLFMHSHRIDIDRYVHHGNYSFQYCTDSSIRRAVIHSKDAFWNTDNITITDSELHGEYLGWYSKNLTLINCHISGTQPLCYVSGLTMVNCTFDPDCDLAFEESRVVADIASDITSVKNPRSGIIKARHIGEVMLDRNAVADSSCKILTAR